MEGHIGVKVVGATGISDHVSPRGRLHDVPLDVLPVSAQVGAALDDALGVVDVPQVELSAVGPRAGVFGRENENFSLKFSWFYFIFSLSLSLANQPTHPNFR